MSNTQDAAQARQEVSTNLTPREGAREGAQLGEWEDSDQQKELVERFLKPPSGRPQ